MSQRFCTAEAFSSMLVNINKNKSSFLMNSDDVERDEALIDGAASALDKSTQSFLRHIHNDDNVFWENFIKDWEPNFERYDKYIPECFLVLGIVEVVIQEVKIIGVISSVMNEVQRTTSMLMERYEWSEEDLSKYDACIDDYSKTVKFSLLWRRMEKSFENINSNQVNEKFDSLKKEVVAIDQDLKEKADKINAGLDRNKEILDVVEARTSFASLYSGFDSYATEVKKRRCRAVVEKYFLFFVMVGVLIAGAYWRSIFQNDVFVLLSFVGSFALAGMLLRVCLRTIDKLDYVISTVEHKLAVSAFYENRIEKVESSAEKEKIVEEYYRFLFSKIDSSTIQIPDLSESVAKLVSNYVKK
jgi:hypothetical protein